MEQVEFEEISQESVLNRLKARCRYVMIDSSTENHEVVELVRILPKNRVLVRNDAGETYSVLSILLLYEANTEA